MFAPRENTEPRASAAMAGLPGPPFGAWSGQKYRSQNYADVRTYDYPTMRRNARGVYRENLIAGGIVGRLDESVINSGLVWESSPAWRLLPDSPQTEDARAKWTQDAEARWKLYASGTEADIEGSLTFAQLQSRAFRSLFVDGEVFGVLRYSPDRNRMSPLSVQHINPEQVANPSSADEIKRISDARGSVRHGIEHDRVGRIVAAHVRSPETGETVRIPVRDRKSGKRFLIHARNYEVPGEARGIPELSFVSHELGKLTTYTVAELEGVLTQSAIVAMLQADVKAQPSSARSFLRADMDAPGSDGKPGPSIEKTDLNEFGLVLDRLPPGYEFKGFSPTRPNHNFGAFMETFETEVCARLSIPRSVYAQKFQGSYSAARAEILFFWNSVLRRRADFVSGYIAPIHAAWMSECVRAGQVLAPGWGDPVQRNAWLAGSWDGISRPVVDPMKETKAVRERLEMGHTTGDREAKIYNGSDFHGNCDRLKEENELLSMAMGEKNK